MLRSRTARLLIPLIFGMLVIVPPQAYIQIVEALGYPDGFVDFYLKHYLAFGQQFCPNPCIVLPTWNHLWFVVYLWVYTMALGVGGDGRTCARRLDRARACAGSVRSVAAGRAVAGLCGLPAVAVPEFSLDACAVRRLVQSRDFATVFLIGFLLAHSTAFWQAVERQRWIALVAAVALYAVFISLRSVGHGGMPLRTTFAVAYGCYQWLCMVAVLGFARRWLNRDSRGAALPDRCDLSLLHRAPDRDHHDRACACKAAAFRRRAEAGIVIGGTAITCIVTFEIVRRVAWLRPLFGLKRSEAAPVVGLLAGGQAAH